MGCYWKLLILTIIVQCALTTPDLQSDSPDSCADTDPTAHSDTDPTARYNTGSADHSDTGSATHSNTGSAARYRSLVITKDGPVEGVERKIQVDEEQTQLVDVFWGIPYAQAPILELRFQRPVPVKQWVDTLDATKPPPSCMQILGHPIPVYVPDPSTPVSEDCLYLNIWRPRCLGGHPYPSHGTPSTVDDAPATMVFLHGGGYMAGSSTVSSYDGAMLAASQCVIVANINYRLGALGFMYLGIPQIPGNMGMLDQALALRWIKNNIRNFGGDPETITIFGQSAGGASTALFLVSPLTQDLYARAIIQSGSPISHLAIQATRSAIDTAHEFSKAFGCYDMGGNNSAIAECLKQVDAVSLTEEHLNLVRDYRHFMTAVPEGYFLMKNPIDSLRTNNFKNCPVLLGTTKDEGTFFMGLKWPETYNFLLDQNTSISEQELDKKLEEFFVDFLNPRHIPSVISDVKRVYGLTQLRETEFDPHLSLIKDVIGDVINTCPIHQIAQFVASSPNQAWVYRFVIPVPKSRHPAWVGAIHGAEIDYVFGKVLTDSAYSEDQLLISHQLMSYWGNFAKYGGPTRNVSESAWRPHDLRSTKHSQYLVITDHLEDIHMASVEDVRCAYWAGLPSGFLK